uniref:Uncharacterized protein n=1 Tax=Timema shepardi TaxID=629360 RepID=A0A7R9APC4_TIMSH|nr:unnamed protein product [Timema shepardi]
MFLLGEQPKQRLLKDESSLQQTALLSSGKSALHLWARRFEGTTTLRDNSFSFALSSRSESMTAPYVAAFLSLVVAAGCLLAPVSCELCPNGVCPPPQIGSCPENSTLPCVPKCCPLGQSLGSDQTCQPSATPFRPYFSEGERALGNGSDDAEVPALNDGNSHLLIGDPCHNTSEGYTIPPKLN